MIMPVKAVRIHEDGGPEVLRYEDVPDPSPGPGEVLVELRAASLNHLDVWVRKGLPSVPKPHILGADGAGVVAALGEGVDSLKVGDRVVMTGGIHGQITRLAGGTVQVQIAEKVRVEVARAGIAGYQGQAPVQADADAESTNR